jgi:hypothetical protein
LVSDTVVAATMSDFVQALQYVAKKSD